MRNFRKSRQQKIKHRYISQHNISNVTTASPSANKLPTVSPSNQFKAKLRIRKRPKLLKRFTKNPRLNTPSILAKKLTAIHKGVGTPNSASGSDIVVDKFNDNVPVQESKNLILRLLGDESAENELHMCYEDDANLLQDMDLVILAANTEDYKRYCQLLRREYEHMSDEDYKNMRLKVLQTLLSIPNIYSTAEFQRRYEDAARTNIKDEINALKA